MRWPFYRTGRAWVGRCGRWLKCFVDFIFGLPGETPADRELTLAAIQRLTEMGATINSHFFMPLPGAPPAGQESEIIEIGLCTLDVASLQRLEKCSSWSGQRVQPSAPIAPR